MKDNILLLTDSYKQGHHAMLPEGTESVYSYLESRVGAKYPETVFFGLQAYLKRYFEGVVVTQDDIEEADAFCKEHFLGADFFNREMWEHIVNKHGGRLPLRIKAVAEGTPVTIGNVMMTVENTDPKCAALTNVFETILTHVWHSSNVATISRNVKLSMKHLFDSTVEEKDYWLLDYMLHDFGFRGVSSVESAGMGGAGHLVNFKGTDTIIAISYAQKYYNTKEMVGYSVAATEHSIMTARGPEGEFNVVRELIRKYPDGILSVVSDSYDIENAIRIYGTELKDNILNRNDGAKFVVRPDSLRFEGDKAADQIVWILEELEKYFGSTVNTKGFKELNPRVGVIWGDGISADEIEESLSKIVERGFTARSCVFGMGGGLLQKHNRDTQRNAFKCSAQKRNGEWVDIFKDPKDKSKVSKRGRLALVQDEFCNFHTVPEGTDGDLLKTVFENGELVNELTWKEVRKNAEIV